MELGIVIPLKAKVVAKNWIVTSGNLKSTVDSVLAQNCETFRAVVVGHDRPMFFSEHPYQNEKCEFMYYDDFEPPKTGKNESENQLKYEFDRCTKILRGMMYLNRKFPSITHWFSLDADDLIRNDFVEVLKKYNNFEAIILDRGYFYFKNVNIINKENEFSAYCGSSAIITAKLFELPTHVDQKSYRCTPFGDISHVHMKTELSKKGYSIGVPEERIIMYVRDNGENISNDAYCNTTIKKLKKIVKMILRYKHIGKDVRVSFGIK
jgi:hypothetical protein